MKVKKVIGPLQNATAPQLGEKGHFAKLNKFAGKKEFSQKASPCANLFLNQRGRGTLTVPSHTLPPSEGVGSYVYRQTERRMAINHAPFTFAICRENTVYSPEKSGVER